MTDFSEGEERNTFLEHCKEAYKAGNDIVSQLINENYWVWPKTFDGTHPLALALALNEAILYSDVLNDYGKAMEIYQTALTCAESSENAISSASADSVERSREYLEEYNRVKELLEGNIDDLQQEFMQDEGDYILPLYPESDSDIDIHAGDDSDDYDHNHDYVNVALLSPSISDIEDTTSRDLDTLLIDIGARLSDLRREVSNLGATDNPGHYLDTSPTESERNLNLESSEASFNPRRDGLPEDWDILL